MTATVVALIAATLSLIAATLSAVIASTAALRVARSQHELARARDAEAAAIGRSVEFFAAFHAVSLWIGRMAYASIRDPLKEERAPDDLTDRFNSALAAIRIADPPDVAAAAMALDRGLIKLGRDAKSRRWQREEWRRQRSNVEALVTDFVNASRRSIERLRKA
jgi:hypothetical protein